MPRQENPSTAGWIGIAAASTVLLGGVAWWLLRDDTPKKTGIDKDVLIPGLVMGSRAKNPLNLTSGI